MRKFILNFKIIYDIPPPGIIIVWIIVKTVKHFMLSSNQGAIVRAKRYLRQN